MAKQKKKIRKPPRGLSRIFYRFPIMLYRMGLGSLMGKRMLLLEHMGRKSGKKRRAVLEIIRHDPTVGVFYVVSGFGKRSDWIRNVEANPDVRINVAGKSSPAIAALLNQERTAAEILDYAERNPKLIRVLADRLLGYKLDDTKEDLLQLASNLQVVRFHIRKEEPR